MQMSAVQLFVYADRGSLGSSWASSANLPVILIIFCICSVAYLVGWTVMKALVPRYQLIGELRGES